MFKHYLKKSVLIAIYVSIVCAEILFILLRFDTHFLATVQLDYYQDSLYQESNFPEAKANNALQPISGLGVNTQGKAAFTWINRNESAALFTSSLLEQSMQLAPGDSITFVVASEKDFDIGYSLDGNAFSIGVNVQ